MRGADPAYLRLGQDVGRLLASWDAPDDAQAARRREFLDHLDRHADAASREGPPEHFTASCLVLSADRSQVLLTLHRKAGMWLQLGGHLEAEDETVEAAAQREAREESGLADLEVGGGLVDLDRHELAGSFGSCRAHLDLRFVAVAAPEAPGAQVQASAESLQLRWWPVDGLPAGTAPDVSRLVAAARRMLGPVRALG